MDDACYYRHSSASAGLQPLRTLPPSILHSSIRLTNDHLAIFREIVRWDLEVERGGSLSYATRNVVVGSVAGAEPAAKVAGLADGDTSKMGADTCCFVSFCR